MSERCYRTVDKTAWGPGQWTVEPDKVQWTDEATGLPCLVVRGPLGALCGYAGVGPDHPWHGRGYADLEVEVHGGLTFAARCDPTATAEVGICHVPEPGEPDDLWWFGFDCAHAFDLAPVMELRLRAYGIPPYRSPLLGETYRDLTYVRDECSSLAAQLAAPVILGT